MTDINKELRAELDKIFAYGIDWTEYKDKSENDHQVSTFAGKIKEELKDELVAKIKALVVESIPPNVEDPTSSATEPYTVDEVFRVSRNLTLGEIRSIWE